MSKLAMIAVVALAAAIVSCRAAQPPATTTPPTPSLTPTATASPPPVVTSPPVATTPSPTAQAADPCAGVTADDPATPPEAWLTGADGTAVAGRLGTYTYCATSADALPPRAENLIAVAVSVAATLSLAAPGYDGIVGYQAGYWPASEWQGDEIRYAAAELPEPVTNVGFAAPPTGDWMLALNFTFASGGGALYYWHVTVP